MEALESHRREMLAVFCDLRGFTAFAEIAEPEEVMNVLREYHAALGVLIHEFEGTLERFVGDGVLVLFNDRNFGLPRSVPARCENGRRHAGAARRARSPFGGRASGHALGFWVGNCLWICDARLNQLRGP